MSARGREVPNDGSLTDGDVSIAAAARASRLGATVMATPWTPPPNMKSNDGTVAGSLNVASYGAYADHLLAFRDFMQSSGVPLYAISVQNEPDIEVTYESCDWTAGELGAQSATTFVSR